MNEPFSYTACIRTLGTAGRAYQALLDSLCAQTIKPSRILVYIAEGYPLPKETCGQEEYIYCKKGMVSQRALPFDEVSTEWILFCDDDICLEKDAVERLHEGLGRYPGALCISPNTYPNHLASKRQKIAQALGLTLPHKKKEWAFIIRKSMHYSYNSRPREVLPTQSAAGPCCLVQKKAYLRLNFAQEAFLDDFKVAIGEDALFFYKLYKMGAMPLVYYGKGGGGVLHLDAGSSHAAGKALHRELSTASFFVVWHRAMYSMQKGLWRKAWCALCYWAAAAFSAACRLPASIIKRDFSVLGSYLRGIRRGARYVKTEKYKSLPPYFDEERDRL